MPIPIGPLKSLSPLDMAHISFVSKNLEKHVWESDQYQKDFLYSFFKNSKSDITNVFGPKSEYLFELLKNLDITHPDANTIFSGFFTCEKKLKSILEFIDLSKDKNYKQINESILQSARKFFNLNFKNINRMNYGHFARFVSEKCERDRIRRFKKTKSVDVKIGSRWFDTSDGFNFC